MERVKDTYLIKRRLKVMGVVVREEVATATNFPILIPQMQIADPYFF